MQAIDFTDYWHHCLYLNVERATQSSHTRLEDPHLAKVPKDSGAAGLALGILPRLHNPMGVEVAGSI